VTRETDQQRRLSRRIEVPREAIELLSRTRFAVIGFGNQGRAHALNLRDAGARVVVGCRPGRTGWDRSRSDGFEAIAIAEAVAGADLTVVSLPDEAHESVWQAEIEPSLPRGATIGFLHGFSVHHQLVRPKPVHGVVLVAPKGPGHALRRRHLEGLGLPALFAVHQPGPDAEHTRALGLAWAHGIGCSRAAIIETTFAAETETDLFGEQAVLCGGMITLVEEAFRALVESGYPEDLAYMECCQELKQIADLVFERGLSGMRAAISNTAEFGAFVASERLADDALRSRLRALLSDVRSGAFAARFRADADRGFPWMHARRAQADAAAIERAGEAVRAWMPWLSVANELERRP
jgi:ketol-acid reductoisomerase